MDPIQLALEKLGQQVQELKATLSELVQQKSAKAAYDTDELAQLLGRRPYTIREWARKKLIPATKKGNRRWIVSHEVLLRISCGELPLPEQEAVNGMVHTSNASGGRR